MRKRLHIGALLFIMVFMCLSATVQADELVAEPMDISGILHEGGLLKEQPVTYSISMARTAIVSDTEGAKAALIKALDELVLEVNLAEFHISSITHFN